MPQADIDGIARSGALARRRGESFHSNPHFRSSNPDLLEWQAVASAWAADLLAEDAGRDEAVAALMRVPMW